MEFHFALLKVQIRAHTSGTALIYAVRSGFISWATGKATHEKRKKREDRINDSCVQYGTRNQNNF